MTVERFIAVYDKEDDSLLDDIKIGLPTADLLDILEIDTGNDPDVYKSYQITEPQFSKLKAVVPELQQFGFNNVRMNLECFSIE